MIQRPRKQPAPHRGTGIHEAVETCWSPLTPEHGFPSLTSQDSGRSPSVRRRHCPQKTASKKQETRCGPPAKNHDDDFLRRHYPHQVKGRSLQYFLSARCTSSPVFDSSVFYTHRAKIARGEMKPKPPRSTLRGGFGHRKENNMKKQRKSG